MTYDPATLEACAKVVDGKQQQILRQFYQDTASRLAAEMLGNAAYAIRSLPASPAPVGDGWQTMESAPKDGSYVLVSNGHFVDVARWSHGSFGGFRKENDATHWRPLPAPPSDASGEK